MLQLENGLLPYQETCSLFLLQQMLEPHSKGGITIKAPTGAGKTVILIDFIQRYLEFGRKNTAFLWFCPGQGELEEQSREKMRQLLPQGQTCDLSDALLEGFECGSTTFINWELVTKSGNRAMVMESEQETLFDKIAEAHGKGIEFIILVDEEHSNDTQKAQGILQEFQAKKIIRVSATAKRTKEYEFYEIDEREVIASGLISKALYINENVSFSGEFSGETQYLLELADKKRKEIAEEYELLAKEENDSPIRPLIIVQLPNANDVLLGHVEDILEEKGYCYENGLVSKWLSHEKENLDGLTDLQGKPVFLLMKQAISMGWDCPRAKILVKLRSNMSENFEIQTLGRIRRMPRGKHYDVDLLDFCYLYTFDEEYKNGVRRSLNQAFEVEKVVRKEKCSEFFLEKQRINKDLQEVQELEGRDVLFLLYDYFVSTFSLGKSPSHNGKILEKEGFILGNEIYGRVLEGKFVTTQSILDDTGLYRETTRTANLKSHRMDLYSAIHFMKSVVGLPYEKMQVVLKRLFFYGMKGKETLLFLKEEEYVAFLINNQKKLREEFRLASTQMMLQQIRTLPVERSRFFLPEVEFYRSTSEESRVLQSNAYENYATSMKVKGVRWESERLFEDYCEVKYQKGIVDWVYKNGDCGKQYFSLVYLDATMKQRLFYPDYVVKLTSGAIWIVEGKGGEQGEASKNIDENATNKFRALKEYAVEKQINFAFIRDKDGILFGNMTEFSESMDDFRWMRLDSFF